LARYGKGAYPLTVRPHGRGWLSLAEIEARHGGALQRFTLQGREEVLTLITSEVASTAILRLDRGSCATNAAGWTITWKVLPDLELRAACTNHAFEVAYDANGVAKYAPDFLISFAWLYLNALLREARQVNPALPKLSSYF
jgi:hypothetical protein